LASLIWLAAAAGATEPLAEGVDSAPASEASEGIPLPDHGKIAGKVTQTMDVAQYTYLEIDTGKSLVWAAGPVTKVKVGDTVEVSNGIQMLKFHSATLDRTFDEIHLVPTIQVWSPKNGGLGGSANGGHGATDLQGPGVERIEGGQTVGEIIAGKTSLAGSEVAVRGKVTKMNTGIMGRNWLHLSDGTAGPEGEQDLTVNTEDIAAVGSTVVVRGTVATDRDFGSGYQYSVLIENAKVTAE
jgi:hypothetical protein